MGKVQLMKIHITDHHTEETCLWCEKSKECVTANFDDGFIGKALLCWSCLQKAIKVRGRKETNSPTEQTKDQL